MRPQHILNLIIICKHSREQETAEEPLHREVEEKEEVTLRSSWLSSVFSPLSCLHILRRPLVSSGHGSSHSSQPEFVSTITDRRSDSSSTAYAFASTASLSHNKTEWMPCKSRSMKSKYLWSHSNLIRYRKEFWIARRCPLRGSDIFRWDFSNQWGRIFVYDRDVPKSVMYYDVKYVK